MNILKIIDEIERTDVESERFSRKDMFKQAASLGKKVALVALPLTFSGMLNKTYGKTKESVGEVLNYALTLEYLEDEFYKMGLAATGLIPDDRKVIFGQISKHESAHVNFLKSALASLSVTPVEKPDFDFTANGTFADVFTNYQTFLTLSQALEDTGVRAYKGRAVELMGHNDVLTAALQIHSVEARHASMIRRLLGEKGWITGNSGAPAAVYDGEDNVTHGGTNVSSLGYSTATITQAFDEPLTPNKVLAIAGQFIVV